MDSINPLPRVTIGDQEYQLKLTFAASEAVERQLEAGFHILLERIARKDLRVGDVATVIREAIVGGGTKLTKAPSRSAIGDAIMEDSKQFFIAYTQLVLAVATSGKAKLPEENEDTGEAPAT